MRKVKFLVGTAYKGPRKEGDTVTVPDDYAKRWVKNGIAAYVDGDTSPEQPEEEHVEVPEEEPTVSEEVLPTENEAPTEDEAVDYSTMTAKDLYTLCKDKGIEVEAKKSKEYYIEKLNA